MNFQQLEYALAVHRQKHFGNAAEQCGVTQATLSAMLKRLEEEIGYLLFNRSSHPIQTTEEGIAFMTIAEDILSKKEMLFTLKEDQTTELKGKLSLGIIPTVSNSLLPIILPDILEKNPKLQLNVKEITTEEIIQQLNNNQIDLGILSTPLPSDFEQLEETILYYESMMVYGIQDEKQYISTKDVKDKKIWLLEEGHCFRNQSMAICDLKEKKMAEQQLNIKVNSFETLLNLSDQFNGFTLIPELFYNNLKQTQKDKSKYFQAPIPVREISLVSNKPLTKRKTMNFLAQLIQEKIPPLLKSSKYPNKDLDIIAM